MRSTPIIIIVLAIAAFAVLLWVNSLTRRDSPAMSAPQSMPTPSGPSKWTGIEDVVRAADRDAAAKFQSAVQHRTARGEAAATTGEEGTTGLGRPRKWHRYVELGESDPIGTCSLGTSLTGPMRSKQPAARAAFFDHAERAANASRERLNHDESLEFVLGYLPIILPLAAASTPRISPNEAAASVAANPPGHGVRQIVELDGDQRVLNDRDQSAAKMSSRSYADAHVRPDEAREEYHGIMNHTTHAAAVAMEFTDAAARSSNAAQLRKAAVGIGKEAAGDQVKALLAKAAIRSMGGTENQAGIGEWAFVSPFAGAFAAATMCEPTGEMPPPPDRAEATKLVEWAKPQFERAWKSRQSPEAFDRAMSLYDLTTVLTTPPTGWDKRPLRSLVPQRPIGEAWEQAGQEYPAWKNRRNAERVLAPRAGVVKQR
jgi:hypothetical protein